MYENELKELTEKMDKSISALQSEYASIRTGQANASLLDRVFVEYYGSRTPVNQVASVTVPQARLIVIQPWDKSLLKEIEKAILQSDLGLTPMNDGNLIRLAIPQLTEERRKELSKVVSKKSEEGKIAIRNIRRDGMDFMKKEAKKSDVSEAVSYTHLDVYKRQALNMLREVAADRLKVDSFELSQNYLSFYDKLEKANNVLEMVITHAEEPINGQCMRYILTGMVDVYKRHLRRSQAGIITAGKNPDTDAVRIFCI